MPQRLPEYQQQVRPQSPGGRLDAIGSAAGAGAASAAWVDAMAGVSRVFAGIAEKQARETEAGRVADMAELGRNAIELDESGRPRQPTLRPNDSAANRAWNAAVVQGYEDAAEQHWASQMMARRGEFRDNPEGFRAWAAASVQGATGEMDPRIRGRVGARLSALAEGHFRALAADQQQRQFQQAQRDWHAQAGVLGEEIARFALTGQGDSEAARAARARLDQHFAAGRAAGHISADGERLAREQVANNAVAFGIAGRAEAIARRDGPEAAERWVEESLSDPRFAAAGDQALREARAAAMRRIGFVRGERGQEQGALRGELETVRASIRAGVQVPAPRLEEYAGRAERAGMAREAAGLRALGRVQGEIAALARAPLPRLMETLAEAERADPADPASAVRVAELRGMIGDRAQALQQDPVAWADQDDGVREVRRRVEAGQATMTDLVRARDEVLRANGADPSLSRVLSAATAQEIVRRVQQTAPSEAAQALLGVFSAYGPELRWRVQNDLRAARLPANLRPVAMMLAGPGGEAVARAYIEATKEGDEAINRPLTEDTRRQVRDAIHRSMEDVRSTFAGTGGDMDLMSDMERAVDVLARVYARTMPPREAAERARREVVDRAVDVVEWSNARLRVPRGVQFDRPEFRRALDGLSHSLDEVELVVPPGAVSAELTPEEARAAYRDSLRARGVWRTDHDGMGAVLHDDQGRPVVFRGEGGVQTPYRLRFDENPRAPAALSGGNFGIVRRLAAAGGVDATWAAAVARAENGGRTEGESRAGALGLMQLMPGTARDMARRIGVAYDEAKLRTDPEYNARLGVEYLRFLGEQPHLRGNRALITAAYNAGPERVRQWLDGEIANLPRETVDYVAKVLGPGALAAARNAEASRRLGRRGEAGGYYP